MAGLLAGCDGTVSGPSDEVGLAASELTWTDGANTLEVNAEIHAAECDGEQARVRVNGELIAPQPFDIVALSTIDAGGETETSVVGAGDWALVGRNFIAGFDIDVDVPDGMHRLDVCFAILTPSGPSASRGCLDPVELDIDCSDDPPPMDMMPPTISGSASPAANGAGWNNSDVTVSFSCADEMGGSGLASCSGPVTLSAEGAGQSASGSAADNAGNTASTTVSGINIDKTAPSVSASRSSEPNAAGWYNAPVTVSFACSDALSGIASCAAPVVLGSDGADQSASGSAVDNADNSASASMGNIDIDMTPPVVTLTGGGTYTIDQNVNVTCSATDALSGIATNNCASASGPAYTFSAGTVSASATDNAGNTGSASVQINVIVTGSSLCQLTRQFGNNSTIESVACALLTSAQSDLNNGQNFSARLKLMTYQLFIATLGRSAFSSEEVVILRSLAAAMMP